MRILNILLLSILFMFGCKKDPSPPGEVSLVAPERNSECSPIDSDNGDTNLVQFSWQAASSTDAYILRVSEINSGVTQTDTISALSGILAIAKGAPFSWSVTATNREVSQTSVSETRFFFSPGTETSFAPFPAEVLQPEGPKAFIDSNGEIDLQWQGSDLDNDIDGYELFFGTTADPSLFSSLTENETSVKVAVVSNTIYYWRLIVRDREGNTSDTGLLSFEAI